MSQRLSTYARITWLYEPKLRVRMRTLQEMHMRRNTVEVGGPPNGGRVTPPIGWGKLAPSELGAYAVFGRAGCRSCAACQDSSLFLAAFPRPGVLALHVDPMSPVSRNQLPVEYVKT